MRQTSSSRSHFNRPLQLLLAAYLILGVLYSVVTPIFEASDELWHYPMVKYLADHALALPVQDPSVDTAWRQEGSQPPLYYLLGAALTFGIDTSDLDNVRRVNPHADIGVVVPDGNVNMMVHDPAAESFPWRGTVLAVHLVRLLSVALAAVTVLMTYRLTSELFPDQQWLALGAAAFTAFNPMFLFISGSVNNDNLSNALASVLLVLIVQLLKRTDAPSIRDLIGIGLIAGAGMIAKFNIGFLLPIIALALALNAYRVRDWRALVRGALITGTLTVLIAGWWYVRNAQLYGDVTGLNMFIRIVGPRTIPANLPQLWAERHTFLMSYWGFFGGVNVPLPDAAYAVFNTIAALATLGLVVGLILPRARLPESGVMRERGARWPILLGRTMTALWIVVLFISLLRWTSATWASQGRLMFSAIAPLSMWMVVGLAQLGRPVPLVRWRTALYAVWWFGLAAALCPILLNRVYHPPAMLPLNRDLANDKLIALFHDPGEPSGTIMALDSSIDATRQMLPSQVRVGEYLQFCQYFYVDARAHFSQNWSAFIHLENEDGVIAAQRDVYPGQGLWATTILNSETHAGIWCNRFAVQIPLYSYAPQTLKVYLGFYNLETGTRLAVESRSAEHAVDKIGNRVLLGTVQLLPRESPDLVPGVPNPMRVNFGGEVELVGYDVSSLLLQPDQKVTITFYWRALHPLKADYRVFAQILQPNSTIVFGGDDAMPAAWSRPTSSWQPGEIVADPHTFNMHSDAQPGTWQIVTGMYQTAPDGSFRRLRIITPDGGEAADFVTLSRVKIIPKPTPTPRAAPSTAPSEVF